MESFFIFRQKIINSVLITNLLLAIIFIFFNKPIAIGLIMGMCFALISFNLKCKTLLKATNNNFKASFLFINYLVRLFIYAVAILLAYTYNEISLGATIFSLLTINFFLIFYGVLAKDG